MSIMDSPPSWISAGRRTATVLHAPARNVSRDRRRDREVEESACKPDPVRGPEARRRPSLSARASASPPVRSPGRCGLPGSSDGPPSNAACLTLLRVGLAEPRRSPDALVSSYLTVSPLPRRGGPRAAVCSLLRCPRGRPRLGLPSTLPCGVRTFLDRSEDRPRPPGRLLRSEHTAVDSGAMRWIAVLAAAWVLAGSACSSTPNGPVNAAEQAQLSGTEAVIQAEVRGTAADLVEAYAAAGRDHGASLRPLVGGKTLPHWVHWLGVQNEQFPGVIEGSASVPVVGIARHADLPSVETDDRVVREVDVVAQVDVHATPTQGDPISLTWDLSGPMLVAADAERTWRITDFYRDTIPMSAIFQVIEDVDVPVGPRVRVVLDSFVAAPVWQFDLMVTVGSGSPVSLDAADATLVDGSGAVIAEAGDVTEGLRSIQPGDPAEGVVTFDARPDAKDLLLRLDFGAATAGAGTGDEVPVVEIPLEGVIEPLPVVGTQASPSPEN